MYIYIYIYICIYIYIDRYIYIHTYIYGTASVFETPECVPKREARFSLRQEPPHPTPSQMAFAIRQSP